MVSVIQIFYIINDLEDKIQSEKVLPELVFYFLLGMLLIAIIFYILFMVYVSGWFSGETAMTQ